MKVRHFWSKTVKFFTKKGEHSDWADLVGNTISSLFVYIVFFWAPEIILFFSGEEINRSAYERLMVYVYIAMLCSFLGLLLGLYTLLAEGRKVKKSKKRN